MRALLVAGFALVLAVGAIAEEDVSPERQRARELAWAGEYLRSLDLYRGLLQDAPSDLALRREVGLTQLWAGRELDAIESLQIVVAAEPADAEARLNLGRAHYYLGDARSAVAHYALALPELGRDPALVAEAIRVFRAGGRPEMAEAWLAHARETHPGRPELALIAAEDRAAGGDLEGAESDLAALAAAHPDDEAVQTALATVREERASPLPRALRLGNEGHYGPARRLLEEHLAAQPDDREARRQLARYNAWSGRVAEAQGQLARLLVDTPHDRDLRTELAEVTSWRGEYAEARAQLETLIAERPDDHRARLALGNVHAWSGVHRLADRTYREILAEAPGHEGAARQLRELDLARATSFEPGFSYFQDNGGFSLWRAESEARFSPKPGRSWSLALDVPRVEGRVSRLVDPITGFAEQVDEEVDGFGLTLAFQERPNERWQVDAAVGLATLDEGGTSPRARLAISRWLGYRHMIQLDLQHGEALTDVRSIESALRGIERSTAFLVHSYRGERLESWTRFEFGRYSDDPTFWTVRSVVGYALAMKPVKVEVLALGTVGDYSDISPSYYSPQDLLSYGVGIRLKKKLLGRADLVVIGEIGRIHSDGGVGTTYRIGPELSWDLTDALRLYLRYDHYQSLRDGLVYQSDFVRMGLRTRFPVRP